MRRALLLSAACLLGHVATASAAPAQQALAPTAVTAERFPIDGEHRYGGAVTRFGGGRGHQGADVFADCGTRLRAVAGGRVRDAKFHGSAGHYVVIHTASGRDHVYAHLRIASRLRAGDRVAAGDTIGSVGDSGNAWDCHLHFETWTAPGWYAGGRPVDPLPFLKSLATG